MSEHVWKIGDWCEYQHSTGEITRYLVYRVTPTHNEGVFGVWGIGECEKTISPHSDNKSLKHLPNCDSWDWKPTPKLQLREGAWYERADGKVVGPCKLLDRDSAIRHWDISGYWYAVDGKHCASDALNLIREVPKPEPKYRPFANAAEFAPHRDRWLTNKDGKLFGRACGYSDAECWFASQFREYNGNWGRCFGYVIFDDTKEPFGVEVTE